MRDQSLHYNEHHKIAILAIILFYYNNVVKMLKICIFFIMLYTISRIIICRMNLIFHRQLIRTLYR